MSAAKPPATPEEINAAYARAGGYRFEFEQIRKTGQATTALQEQWQARCANGAEHSALQDITGALTRLRQSVADSRDAATTA